MLTCIREFNQGEYRFTEGATIALALAAETWLIESFPGNFERVEPAPAEDAPAAEVAEDAPEPAAEVEARDVEAPAVDKMVRKPHKRK